MIKLALILHLLGATIWTGGHLILAIGFLPQGAPRQGPQDHRGLRIQIRAHRYPGPDPPGNHRPHPGLRLYPRCLQVVLLRDPCSHPHLHQAGPPGAHRGSGPRRQAAHHPQALRRQPDQPRPPHRGRDRDLGPLRSLRRRHPHRRSLLITPATGFTLANEAAGLRAGRYRENRLATPLVDTKLERSYPLQELFWMAAPSRRPEASHASLSGEGLPLIFDLRQKGKYQVPFQSG